MNNLNELAKLFSERNNNDEEILMIGTIESLPELTVRLSDKIVLDQVFLKTLIDLNEKDEDNNYINLNQSVFVAKIGNKFYVLGVIKDV